MDDIQREGIKSGSTLVPVSRSTSKDSGALVYYESDDANVRDKYKLQVFNSRKKSAPRLLNHKGKDYIRIGCHVPAKKHVPMMGDLMFITHTDDSAEREANHRIRSADGTKGEFKGDAIERETLVKRLINFVKSEDKPVLVAYNPGEHKLI